MITRTLTSSGLVALLVAAASAAVWPLAAAQEACTVSLSSQPATADAPFSLDADDALAGGKARAVHEEVTAVFGEGKVKERIADQLRRGLIGTVVDHATGKSTVVTTPEAGFKSALQTSAVITGCHTAAALIAADDVLVSRSWHPQAAQAGYSLSLHAEDSRFHVSFDPSYPEAAQALQAALGERVVVTLAETGRAGRLDDGEAHFGAAGVRQNAGTTANNICTSGFTIRRNADGQRGSITAGHCFYNGAYVYSGPQYYGYTWGKFQFPSYDIIGIRSGTETYDNVLHTDSCCPVRRDVVGYDPAAVGDLVCFSGMVTKAICNIQVTSLNGYFCDSYGCTGGLIEATRSGQVIVRLGDSGAPIYTRYGTNAALAVGMLVGSAGNGTIAYGEHVSVIESYLDVSVLTY